MPEISDVTHLSSRIASTIYQRFTIEINKKGRAVLGPAVHVRTTLPLFNRTFDFVNAKLEQSQIVIEDLPEEIEVSQVMGPNAGYSRK